MVGETAGEVAGTYNLYRWYSGISSDYLTDGFIGWVDSNSMQLRKIRSALRVDANERHILQASHCTFGERFPDSNSPSEIYPTTTQFRWGLRLQHRSIYTQMAATQLD